MAKHDDAPEMPAGQEYPKWVVGVGNVPTLVDDADHEARVMGTTEPDPPPKPKAVPKKG